MIFRSFIGVLKNIFSKRKDSSVFEQLPISDAGLGIYRGPIGCFQGRRSGFPLCRSNKHPIKTLSEPSPDPFPKPGRTFKKAGFIFQHSDETPKNRLFASLYSQPAFRVVVWRLS